MTRLKIHHMREGGTLEAVIAERCGVSLRSVERIVAEEPPTLNDVVVGVREGVPRRGRPSKADVELVRRIQELLKDEPKVLATEVLACWSSGRMVGVGGSTGALAPPCSEPTPIARLATGTSLPASARPTRRPRGVLRARQGRVGARDRAAAARGPPPPSGPMTARLRRWNADKLLCNFAIYIGSWLSIENFGSFSDLNGDRTFRLRHRQEPSTLRYAPGGGDDDRTPDFARTRLRRRVGPARAPGEDPPAPVSCRGREEPSTDRPRIDRRPSAAGQPTAHSSTSRSTGWNPLAARNASTACASRPISVPPLQLRVSAIGGTRPTTSWRCRAGCRRRPRRSRPGCRSR